MKCPHCGNEGRFWVKERSISWVLMDNDTEEIVPKGGEVVENGYDQDLYQCDGCDEIVHHQWENWAT